MTILFNLHDYKRIEEVIKERDTQKAFLKEEYEKKLQKLEESVLEQEVVDRIDNKVVGIAHNIDELKELMREALLRDLGGEKQKEYEGGKVVLAERTNYEIVDEAKAINFFRKRPEWDVFTLKKAIVNAAAKALKRGVPGVEEVTKTYINVELDKE